MFIQRSAGVRHVGDVSEYLLKFKGASAPDPAELHQKLEIFLTRFAAMRGLRYGE